MKLHFSKNWISDKHQVEPDPQITAGPAMDLSAILELNNRHSLEQRWEDFPLRDMADIRWIEASPQEIRQRPYDLVMSFIDSMRFDIAVTAHYRRTAGAQDLPSWLWVSRLVRRTDEFADIPEFDANSIDLDVGRELAQLSVYDDGPSRAKDFLRSRGIALIVERALPGSRLDGAAFMTENGFPVIGLSLRFDRIDYFWFTLLHEFAHVAMHVSQNNQSFVESLDDIDQSEDPQEQEADYFAQEALIPRRIWRRSDAYRRQTQESIRQLAADLSIHPGIIAGRIRRDRNRYDLFTNLVGNNLVRQQFPESGW